MITKYITDSQEAIEAIASPELKNVWINGSETYISTGDDYKDPSTIEVIG